MKRFDFDLRDVWHIVFGYGTVAVLVCSVLFLQLSGIVPGLSQPEASFKQQHLSIADIAESTVQAPYAFTQLIIRKILPNTIYAMRFTSALFAAVILIAYFYLLKSWFGQRVALLGSLLMLISSTFLHSARLAIPDVVYGAFIIPFVLFIIMQNSRRPGGWFVLLCVSAATLMYVPGFLVIFIAALAWKGKSLLSEFQELPLISQVVATALFFLITLPLLWQGVQNTAVAQSILGINPVPGLGLFVHRLLDTLLAIGIRGPQDPVFRVGHVPILDIFSSAMVVIGLYGYVKHFGLDRSKFVFGYLLVGIVLTAWYGISSYSLLLLPLYAIMTAGIVTMIEKWFSVFPKNPIAKYIGVFVMALAVSSSVLYNFSSYFVAWPNTPETRQAFRLKP